MSDLTGAMLDMWVARAEGIPADQLEMRPQPMGESICVRTWKIDDIEVQKTLAYSTSWEDGGPLIEKELITVTPQAYGAGGGCQGSGWVAVEVIYGVFEDHKSHKAPRHFAKTYLEAAMKCIVFAKFGATLPE